MIEDHIDRLWAVSDSLAESLKKAEHVSFMDTEKKTDIMKIIPQIRNRREETDEILDILLKTASGEFDDVPGSEISYYFSLTEDLEEFSEGFHSVVMEAAVEMFRVYDCMPRIQKKKKGKRQRD